MGRLEGLATLLTAKEWERAAILAAYVKVEPRAGRPRSNVQTKNRNKLMTPQEFTDLGIAGLTNHETVARYVNAWMNVAQRPRPKPGDEVEMDGLPDWPQTEPVKAPIDFVKQMVADSLGSPWDARALVELMTSDAKAEMVMALQLDGALSSCPDCTTANSSRKQRKRGAV
jgi:hypothetical protein